MTGVLLTVYMAQLLDSIKEAYMNPEVSPARWWALEVAVGACRTTGLMGARAAIMPYPTLVLDRVPGCRTIKRN